MKTKITTLLLTLLAVTAFSQKSVLWEVTGNGLEKPSYLMGTLKFMGQKEFFIPKEVSQKMKQCKVFAIEDQVDHKAQMELNKAVHLPKGQTLSSVLTPEEYKQLLTFVNQQFHLSKEKFEKDLGKLIPLALSINMTRMGLGEAVKYYDIELLMLAKENKLKTFSLEGIDREAESLKTFPMDEQKEALNFTVNNFKDQMDEFHELEAAFVANDLDKIFTLDHHPTESNADFIQVFYTARNNEWLPRLEKMMKDQASFIAVGVAHLKGDSGLLAQLESKGYTLKAIPLTR